MTTTSQRPLPRRLILSLIAVCALISDAPPTLAQPSPPSRPVVVAFFHPVDGTPSHRVDQLTDVLTRHLQGMGEFIAMDSAALRAKITQHKKPSACVSNPACVAGLAQDLGVDKVIIGHIYTVGRRKPLIMLSVHDAPTRSLEWVLSYESSASQTLSRQRKELWHAIHKAMRLGPGPDERPVPGARCEVDADCAGGFPMHCEALTPDERRCVETAPPRYTSGQKAAIISTACGGFAFLVTGIVLSVTAHGVEQGLLEKNRQGLASPSIVDADLNDAARLNSTANILYGLGGAALLTSIILVFALPQAPDPTRWIWSGLSPTLDANGGGLQWRVEF